MIPAIEPGAHDSRSNPGGSDIQTPPSDIGPLGVRFWWWAAAICCAVTTGVGPVLVRHLWERGVPTGARLVDGGTAGMDVAFQMRGGASAS